jgi:hypothetical protein
LGDSVDNEITGRLENWYIDTLTQGGKKYMIWGDIYDDKYARWRPGTRIHTSLCLTPKDKVERGVIIETMNSRYLLGSPLSDLLKEAKNDSAN